MPLLPVVLLCVVALGQVWLTRASALTPWKGGGFGMFSTSDRGDWGARPVRVLWLDPQGNREAEIPAKLTLAARKAAVLPSDANLRRLGRAVLALDRAGGGDARSVRIEVWGRRYDARTLEPRLEVLRESTVETAASEP